MTRIEDVLQQKLDLLPASRVKDAMAYSLMAGGKRIRPNFLYEVVKGYGLDESAADEFAAAIEMIHTYSLIHDDLPAMDNDDLRRGRPTNHKAFDEAAAILAGDGLLTYAFEVASSSKQPADKVQKCISVLARMAGPAGMVLGQNLDIYAVNGISSIHDLYLIEKYKTGCLLSAPLMMGAILAGQGDDVIAKWHEAGDAIGLAFQIQDDILDIELTPEEFGKSNSDERNDKVTSITLLGKDEAEKEMNALYAKGKNLIAAFEGFDGKKLCAMIEAIETRRK